MRVTAVTITLEQIAALHAAGRIDNATFASATGFKRWPSRYPDFGKSSLARCVEMWNTNTGATISDLQLRELWAIALDTGDRELVRDVQQALGFWRSSTEHLADDEAATERNDARWRCAAAWNARHGGRP